MNNKLNKGRIGIITLLILIFLAIFIGTLVYQKYQTQQPKAPVVIEQFELVEVDGTTPKN